MSTAREQIAKSLGSSIASLVDLWIDSVRRDASIRSDDRLTRSELEDAIPNIIEEIAEMLVEEETPSVVNAREARVHVYTRYQQGYRARDLVRELSLLRLVLLDYVAEISTGPELSLSITDYAEAVRIINLYVDEEMRYAITIYTESQPPSQS